MSEMDKFMNMLFSDSLMSPTNSPLSTHTLFPLPPFDFRVIITRIFTVIPWPPI